MAYKLFSLYSTVKLPSSYADIAQTVMEYLEVAYEGDGDSFLGEIEK